MPKDRLRPRQPLVAMPRTGIAWASRAVASMEGASSRATTPSSSTGAGGEVDGDVAAVIDIGGYQRPPGDQRRQHLVRHRAGDRGHRCHEHRTMRPASGNHAPRHRARRLGAPGAERGSEQRELVGQAPQHVLERGPDLPVGGFDLGLCAGSADDQVDRPVLEMEPAPVRQQADVRPFRERPALPSARGSPGAAARSAPGRAPSHRPARPPRRHSRRNRGTPGAA